MIFFFVLYYFYLFHQNIDYLGNIRQFLIMSISYSFEKINDKKVHFMIINNDHEIMTVKKYKYKIVNSVILPVHMIWELIININHVFISEKDKKQKTVKLYFLDNINDDYEGLIIVSDELLNQ